MDSKSVGLAFSVLFALVHISHGQVLLSGRCESKSTSAMADFDITQYVGKWYEQYRYFAAFEVGLKCVTAEYTPLPDGTVQVNNKGIQSFTGNAQNIEGVARIDNLEEPGKLTITFPEQDAEGQLWIVDTDYQNYSVGYSCRNVPGLNARVVTSWLLSRNAAGYAPEIQAKVSEVLQQNQIDSEKYIKVDQLSCPASTFKLFQ